MGEVDKPFGCPQPGCGMSFTNEDHLMVHRRRHEMQLMVNGDHQTPSLVKHGFIIDQTPTPTRFLRQCEEVGLFQEISLNPFDEQFRRASLLRSQHSVTEVIGGNAGESLNTPRVLPPVDSDETISSTSRDDISGTSTAATSINSTRSITPCVNQTSYTQPQPSARVEEIEEDPLKIESSPRRLSLNVTSASEAGQNTSSVISTPTPVITAGPSVTQSLGIVGLAGGSAKVSGVTQSSSQQSTLCTASSNIPPSPSATVLQLLLRLPNGQAIPVEIPATPVVSSSSSSTTTGSTISTVSTSPPHTFDNSRPPQQSLAKMKLKQALASSSTAARPGCSKTSRANTADRIAEMTRSRNFSGTSSTEGECEDDSTNSSNNVSGKGERRRRHSSDNEDPLEKRRKFLERNRAAAIRCREKKKKWIENLSLKYDELGAHNLKLQTEVSSLRSEVAVLKSMLLQHKDCPVTLAMQGEGSVDNMSNCDNLAPLPSVFAPLSEVRISSQTTHKPRTRSLSLPSIPSSTVTSVEPLPVNLSSSTYTCPASSSVTTSVSSSTKLGKVTVVGGGELVVGGTSNVIVATVPPQVSQATTAAQPHLLNLTLHHSPQSKSSVLRKSN
ncbi:cyclic AMP-dependent transcription factor ATF-2-like isoform X3 [Macrobrachium rosenbergii]|uniref:cyclic AMP-dependent transcription factor ATF-2-like isoform X3 n=1 Tax=Macrobrachium rosenbergii TaxID=79674 RepID=UPI0034D41B16